MKVYWVKVVPCGAAARTWPVVGPSAVALVMNGAPGAVVVTSATFESGLATPLAVNATARALYVVLGVRPVKGQAVGVVQIVETQALPAAGHRVTLKEVQGPPVGGVTTTSADVEPVGAAVRVGALRGTYQYSGSGVLDGERSGVAMR